MPLKDAISIYGPNLIGTFFCSIALALLGTQLASRSESLQAFVASQSASLGITSGLALVVLLTGDTEAYPHIPVILAFVFSTSFYFFAQKLSARFRSKSTEILITLFLFSLSVNYLVTGVLPYLESHFSASFMGDIATASATSSYLLALVSFAISSLLLSRMRQINFQSFWISSSNVSFSHTLQVLFYFVCALLIVESTRVFGFLYTSASLVVIPLAASLAAKSFKHFLSLVVGLSAISSLLGFIISLWSLKLSTSACIVTAQVFLSILAIIIYQFQDRLLRNRSK